MKNEKGRAAYRVRFEPAGDGWWLATAKDFDGCLTQGKSLRQARRRIREALSLFVDDAATAKLKEELVIPAPMRRTVAELKKRRTAFEKAQAAYQEILRVAAKEGTIKLSTRDAAELLDVSQQRVAQLRGKVEAADPPAK